MKIRLLALIAFTCTASSRAEQPISLVNTQSDQHGYVEIVGFERADMPFASVTMPTPDPRDPNRGLVLSAGAVSNGSSAGGNGLDISNRLMLNCWGYGLVSTRASLFSNETITFDVVHTTSINLHYHGAMDLSGSVGTVVGYTLALGPEGAAPLVLDSGVATAPAIYYARPFPEQGLIILTPGRYSFRLETYIEVSGFSCIRAEAGGLVAILNCRKDFNLDGFVDPDDLSDYIGCFFSVPGCDRADFNEDAQVDPDDLSDFIGGYFDRAYGDC